MLPQLQAERQLASIEAAAIPHMSVQSQRETIRSYARLINEGQPAKPATRADLAASGITVEYVDAEGRPLDAGTTRDDLEGQA